jgi:hypothetical protein
VELFRQPLAYRSQCQSELAELGVAARRIRDFRQTPSKLEQLLGALPLMARSVDQMLDLDQHDVGTAGLTPHLSAGTCVLPFSRHE